MAEREKVIKGLECCIMRDPDDHTRCGECPYHSTMCGNRLKIEALALLKAQQPRVMNLNEIHRGMAVWLEDRDKLDVMLAIGGSSAGGAKCFITEDDRSIAPLDEDYNVRWRAWTREPTDAQREAEPWSN